MDLYTFRARVWCGISKKIQESRVTKLPSKTTPKMVVLGCPRMKQHIRRHSRSDRADRRGGLLDAI